ncbi:DUF3558 family protein [Dietzia sp. PP-33]|uniref:DUF3558 family protein n=1 Tax=Dietzia sp. PP-33 TaxID=2957500 RepID=UPI0029A33BA8|nr:DUF3558 family protein [Dietzia sp. PP-33]MDX2358888.1 DUF3558 domain-containing protein [Dietzia sp. PP-33]
MVLSGCVAGQADDQATTTSPTTAEAPSNPWDLPIEQRPALFDPCAEIPVEAVEQGVGGPVEPVDEYTRHQPGGLMVCGWSTDEVDLSVLATWKSRDDYLNDDMFKVQDLSYEVMDRPGLRVGESDDYTKKTCIQIFFTARGTIWTKLDLFGAFHEFKGERFADPCESLDEAMVPIMASFPEGDFR